ncbi:MAG: hypothetical protein GY805_30020 [Chloroflexi bacterium]|nr:hypothetical protein [Chloroflexota bacterium]
MWRQPPKRPLLDSQTVPTLGGFLFCRHNTMTQDQKRALERQLWNIADQLRGKV